MQKGGQTSHITVPDMGNNTVKKLSTTLLRKSKGPKIANGDRVLVYYQGNLLNGEEFDANFDFSSFDPVKGRDPFPFNLGVGEVIKGWDKALKNKRIGSVLELTIPANQAYGATARGGIPANSPLKFKVEVLAALPAGSSSAVFTDYKDLGINPKKVGLSDELIQSTRNLKIGLDAGDKLRGTSSNDLLIGLKGNDRMTGNRGADVLIGGPGKDIYRYRHVKDSRAAKGKSDHILDFGRKDRIDLSAVAKKLQFIGDDRFTGAAGDVRFKKGTLELDKDGDGTADLALQLPGTQTKAFTTANLIL